MLVRKSGPVLFLAFLMFCVAACQTHATPTVSPTAGATQAATVTIPAAPSIPSAATWTVQPPAPAVVTATATAAIIGAPTNAPTLPPAQGQLPVTSSQLKETVVAENLPNPDDLLVAPDGTLYISVIGDGSVRTLSPDGTMETIVTGLLEPEGIILLPDGSLVIAEQGKNRLVRFDPNTKSVTPVLRLSNPNHQLGVDGIALDMHQPDSLSIIIPDSPNGTLLRVSLDGKTVQTIVRGLSRPTGAWVEPDGNILVVEEFGRSLLRILPDGTRVVLANDLSEPDDAVEDGSGRIFVNSLVDGVVHVYSKDGKQSGILASGLHSPQGIAVDSHGNLFVADSGQGKVIKILLP